MNPHVELFLNYSKVADPDTVCCMKRQLQIYKNLPLGKKGPKTWYDYKIISYGNNIPGGQRKPHRNKDDARGGEVGKSFPLGY